jgi:hypothetical protein
MHKKYFHIKRFLYRIVVHTLIVLNFYGYILTTKYSIFFMNTRAYALPCAPPPPRFKNTES